MDQIRFYLCLILLHQTWILTKDYEGFSPLLPWMWAVSSVVYLVRWLVVPEQHPGQKPPADKLQ